MQGIETIEAIGPSRTSSTSLAMRRHNLVPDLVLSNRLAGGFIDCVPNSSGYLSYMTSEHVSS